MLAVVGDVIVFVFDVVIVGGDAVVAEVGVGVTVVAEVDRVLLFIMAMLFVLL